MRWLPLFLLTTLLLGGCTLALELDRELAERTDSSSDTDGQDTSTPGDTSGDGSCSGLCAHHATFILENGRCICDCEDNFIDVNRDLSRAIEGDGCELRLVQDTESQEIANLSLGGAAFDGFIDIAHDDETWAIVEISGNDSADALVRLDLDANAPDTIIDTATTANLQSDTFFAVETSQEVILAASDTALHFYQSQPTNTAKEIMIFASWGTILAIDVIEDTPQPRFIALVDSGTDFLVYSLRIENAAANIPNCENTGNSTLCVLPEPFQQPLNPKISLLEDVHTLKIQRNADPPLNWLLLSGSNPQGTYEHELLTGEDSINVAPIAEDSNPLGNPLLPPVLAWATNVSPDRAALVTADSVFHVMWSGDTPATRMIGRVNIPTPPSTPLGFRLEPTASTPGDPLIGFTGGESFYLTALPPPNADNPEPEVSTPSLVASDTGLSEISAAVATDNRILVTFGKFYALYTYELTRPPNAPPP